MQIEAREVARQLLQSFRESHPEWQDNCTPIEEMVAWLDLLVETFNPQDQSAGTFGFLDAQENLIWLCRTLPSLLRRFTLAHELGHAMLHRKITPRLQPSRQDPCLTDDVREEVSGPIFQEQAEEILGPGVAYDPRSQREMAANIFAAELLMPLERVRALYLARDVRASGLAGIFQVSQSAMLNRLADLVMGDKEVREDNVGDTGESGRGDVGDSSWIARYDEFQRAAIMAKTPALIVAGPGSGKTSTLIGRAAYLIQEQGIAPGHILALTFSRKAAGEMQERLANQGDRKGREDTPLQYTQKYESQQIPNQGDRKGAPLQYTQKYESLPKVSTFHAFCAELLRTHGELVGLRLDFAFIDDAEGYFLLRRIAGELPLHHYQNLAYPAASFPDILGAISRAKDELATPAMYRQLAQAMLAQAQNEKQQEQAEKALEVATVYALYQRRLEQQGDTDFGGLIMLAVQLLQERPEVRAALHEKYQHILVDEFQDINRASGVLLRLLAGEEQRVWVVGDANQAIYGFRGASPANIADFHEDYSGAVVLPLARNYRSRPDIVNLADAFRCQQLEAEAQSGTVQTARATQTEPYITLANAPDEASEFNGIVNDMRRKHEQGYAYRDMVVLCRTRSLARKVTRALIAADLPVIERGGMLEQQHIRSLLALVMLLTDSGGIGILRAARLSDHLFSQQDIEILLQAVHESRSSEQKRTLAAMLMRNDAPAALSVAGRQSFARLSAILKDLRNTCTNVWSLLAKYLFVESSIGRELLDSNIGTEATSGATDQGGATNRGEATDQGGGKPSPYPVRSTLQSAALRADYSSLLQMARYYDQQQQTLRQQQEQQAVERGEEPEPIMVPDIVEQATGFLDYITVLLSLRQDGGSRRESENTNGEESPDVIRVMTVHASKGLEFPVVYLPGIVKTRFPASKRWQPAPPPRGLAATGSDEESAHESGEACLFYVATTRARDHLVISHANRYGKVNRARSPYIDALLAGVADERAMRVAWPRIEENLLTISEGDENDKTVSVQPGEAFIETMKPPTWRSSDIEAYQRCPRQYLYSSIYHFHSESAAYQLFWRATGETLDELQKQIAASKENANGEAHLPTEEEARELYTRYWQSHEGHTLPFGTMYEEHGHEVAQLLRHKLVESGDTHWQLRPQYTVEVAGKTVEVTVDRVETPTHAGEPVKFVKTGFGRRKDKVDPSTRELLYARASRQHHPAQPIALRFHNMSTGKTFEIELKEKKEQKLYEELLQAIAAMERNEFPPRPDARTCPGCPFFLICPA
ncbi:MAG TPA: UvrD-helicase domain-containing protein [Ktedonobacteraceae bacterium]|nr:UvrD-helicase domain-containing protein [Ktedonobacteraceae bacterium]